MSAVKPLTEVEERDLANYLRADSNPDGRFRLVEQAGQTFLLSWYGYADDEVGEWGEAFLLSRWHDLSPDSGRLILLDGDGFDWTAFNEAAAAWNRVVS